MDVKGTPAYLGKPTDAAFLRLVNRRLSRPITLLLARTPVTPNQISMVVLLLSGIAAWLAAEGERAPVAAGGLLFQLGAILDCCDGEIARLKNQTSRLGAVLDKLGDRLMTFTFVIGATIGLVRIDGLEGLRPLAIEGMIAVGLAMALGQTITFLYSRNAPPDVLAQSHSFSRRLMKKESAFGIGPFLRVTVPLLRRDSLALIFCLLALFGRIDWLLGLVWVGANLLLLAEFFSLLSLRRELTLWKGRHIDLGGHDQAASQGNRSSSPSC